MQSHGEVEARHGSCSGSAASLERSPNRVRAFIVSGLKLILLLEEHLSRARWCHFRLRSVSRIVKKLPERTRLQTVGPPAITLT